MLWRNFYWIFLLLSVTGISLYHWTLDAPDTFSFNSLWPQFSISPSLLCHILLHASVNNCKSFAVQRLFLRQLWTFITIKFHANSRCLCFVPSQITSTPSFLISCPSSLPPLTSMLESWRFLLFPEVWGQDLDTLTLKSVKIISDACFWDQISSVQKTMYLY